MLNSHSCYSLKYGMVDPEELVHWGAASGYEYLALTDINNTSAVLNFVRYSKENNRIPVVGVDFRNGISCCYVVLARNNEGFQEINTILSKHTHEETPFPAKAPLFDQCWVIYPWGKEPENLAANEFIGVAAHQLNRFRMNPSRESAKYVALAPMTFRSKRDFNTHRLLRAIDQNVLLSKLPVEEQSRADELFLTKAELLASYEEFELLVHRSEALLKRCAIDFEFAPKATSQNLAFYDGSKERDLELIRRLCEDGLKKRYDEVTLEIRKRIEKEITVIAEKNYITYFLIAWDVISYARSKGYYYVGRGSGANSLVAYLLGITDVDPLELDLYFERFINLYRQNPPDFDMDFSWRDRDDVFRYMFEKFENAALICTYNTFQYKATLRELGKVFGLPKTDIDAISDEKHRPEKRDPIQELVIKYSHLIAGLPSHLSVHAGGIIISEKPIHHFTATFLTSKGYPTTQFSMIEAEDVGLYKFDILSQRGLGKIRDTLDVIAYNQPENPPRDIHDVRRFITDDRINQLLREAKAIGCFYVESPGMRMLLIKLRTNSYLELVAASSIIRPGVASSGMMREYILRHRNPERVKEAHPVLLDIMPETYGVMVYQEDVIKVANQFGGLDLAESDVLRRGMSGKFRSRDEFMLVQSKFFENSRKRGHTEKDIREIWRQIESFAGYAFSKGHSASYAVESYQCLYLKAYYPLEYMVATINNFGGFYRTEVYVLEARKLGAQVEAPCINRSRSETIIRGKEIYLGFQHIAGIELKQLEALLRERDQDGSFTDFTDLMQRVSLPLEQLLLLIRVGALRCFGIPKKELMWNAHLNVHKIPLKSERQPQLFREECRDFVFPELKEADSEEAFEHQELLEFPLCSPFDLLDEEPLLHVLAKDLVQYVNRKVRVYGYLINVKKIVSAKNQIVHFGTLFDQEGEQLDTVHFQELALQYPFRGKGIYAICGKVAEEFGHYTIEVETLEKMPYKKDTRYSD
ncbi:DNA polymerase III subunit alpha [Fluviicola sp.]|uniref:DNA polymerase III subunit alpha n=1 Tax=Fluviicola sp. TaxID=1917219 RepID=UPI0031E27400